MKNKKYFYYSLKNISQFDSFGYDPVKHNKYVSYRTKAS